MADVWELSVIELARRLHRREISSVEIVRALIDRIESHNAAVNALATERFDRAIIEAHAADEAIRKKPNIHPMHGVPITVKDALETADCITTCGTALLRQYRPQRDSSVVARLRSAGAIVLAKTNVPELTNDYRTNNKLFGRTNNPWQLGHSPGGSTGGGAAAVACGFSFLEVGSDLGGSIRLPAHCCGVYGFKPTAGLIPMTGHIPPLPGRHRTLRHLANIGFIGRSPHDLCLALQLTAGCDDVDSTVLPFPLKPFRHVPDVRSLRIAWSEELPGVPCCSEIKTGITSFAQRLERAGCCVDRAAPEDFDGALACELSGTILGAELRLGQDSDRAPSTSSLSIKPADHFSNGYLKAQEGRANVYLSALQARDKFVRQLEKFFRIYDIWLVPTAPTSALPHSDGRPSFLVDNEVLPYSAQGWCCLPFSLTHHPAIAVPLGFTSNGLPYSVQAIGGLWRDSHLIAVIEAIKEFLPPFTFPSLS